MRKIYITIIALFASSILFAQDDVFKAAWVSLPVKVDGNAEEWSKPLRYYDTDTKMFFAFSNDDMNLYICFQTADNINQMKILHAGMEVSLSIKGEHKATINFPLPQNPETTSDKTGDNRQSTDHSGMINKSSFQTNTMEVKGFASRNGIIPINDSSGINAAIGKDAGDKFTYELSIPLKELFNTGYTTEEISKNISMSVKINAMEGKSQSSGNINQNFSAKSGERTGRGGGGGMHHGGNKSSEETNVGEIKEEKTDMFKKGTFKQKFILAKKP